MQLNAQQQKELMAKLVALLSNRGCDVCGKFDWAVADSLYHLPGFSLSNVLTPASTLVPVAVLNCKTCGNIKLFNMIHLGLISNETGGWIDV